VRTRLCLLERNAVVWRETIRPLLAFAKRRRWSVGVLTGFRWRVGSWNLREVTAGKNGNSRGFCVRNLNRCCNWLMINVLYFSFPHWRWVEAICKLILLLRTRAGRVRRKTYMAEGYCVKCKAKKEIANAFEEVMKNGRKAIKGKCPSCGAVMFKIIGGKAAISPVPNPANPPSTTSV